MLIDTTHWSPPDGSSPLPALRLVQAEIELLLLPERGGKIVSLFHLPDAYEWLWLNPYLAWSPPHPNESYVARHDLGGWDECFPTVAPTVVEGQAWPDHGDLWWRPWQAEVRGDALWMGVEGPGYRFTRTIRPAEAGLLFEYEVENCSGAPFPYLWCAHPLFCLNPTLTIELAGRPAVRLGNNNPFGQMGELHRWPRVAGRSLQQVGKPSGLAAKLFVAVETGEVRLSRPDSTHALLMQWPIEQLPLLGLWLNEEGWSGANTPPYCNVGVEPASGAPDDLRLAREEWGLASQLEAGARAHWWLQLSFIDV